MANSQASPSSTVVTVPIASSIRLVYRFLRDAGLHASAAALQREALTSCRVFTPAERDEFKSAVLKGEWDTVLQYADDTLLSDAALFSVWEAIVLDFVHRGVVVAAATAQGAAVSTGIDSATALLYADEVLKRHPVLQKMKAVEAARFGRLQAKAQRPTAADFPSSIGNDDAPAWRKDAWAGIEAELNVADAAAAGGGLTMEAWASLLLHTPTAEEYNEARHGEKSSRRPLSDVLIAGDADADDRRLVHLAARREDALRAAALESVAPFEGVLRESTPCAFVTRASCACIAGERLAIATENGRLALCTTTAPITLIRESDRHSAGFLCACTVALNGQDHVVCGDRTGVIVCYDLQAALVWKSPSPPLDGGVLCLAAAGTDTVCAGGVQLIAVLSVRSGQRLKTLRGQRPVTCISCYVPPGASGDVVHAVTGSSDGTVCLWNCVDGSSEPVAVARPWGPNADVTRVRRLGRQGHIVALRSDGAIATLDARLSTTVHSRDVAPRSKLRDVSELIVTRDGAVIAIGAASQCALYEWEEKGGWVPRWEHALLTGPAAAGGASGKMGPIAAMDSLGRCLFVTEGNVSVLT